MRGVGSAERSQPVPQTGSNPDWAIARVKGRIGARRVVIVSDMRQVTRGASNSSSQPPPRMPSPAGCAQRAWLAIFAASRSKHADSIITVHRALRPSMPLSLDESRRYGGEPSRCRVM